MGAMALTLMGFGCSGNGDTGKKEGPQKSSAVTVPSDAIKNCDVEYFGPNAKNCSDFGGGTVCVFYQETVAGQTSVKTQQFASACNACRHYGKTGTLTSGSLTVTNLGWVKSDCATALKSN